VPHYDAVANATMRYLNLTKNSFHILFPAKGIVSYAGFPRGIESIEKVLNYEIGFQDFEKVLNLAKTYIRY